MNHEPKYVAKFFSALDFIHRGECEVSGFAQAKAIAAQIQQKEGCGWVVFDLEIICHESV